ncbi:hypothetical protein KJ819_00675 [Patescibacteria group bacterium]|nr:hypothetical protein [Patescibacteria group bacterium]MBU1500645.1 hypothetical protein [Patescibacteria group bacterium]MBU2080402.1 hypothetical protein [Patescibacteria group bacterium]MBU2124186.1 hypothetical protein [Patescibacteria group bacterium]MBU2194363.1 hypothetical protein [Patescibacteria group bacterium]
MTKKSWSFDRKLLITFVATVSLACGGVAAKENYEQERASAQRVVVAPASSDVAR